MWNEIVFVFDNEQSNKLFCILFFRHILFAESTVDNYAGSRFPGLSDALTKIQLGEDVNNQWEIVRKHYSVILFTFQSAAATLKDVSNFMYNY